MPSTEWLSPETSLSRRVVVSSRLLVGLYTTLMKGLYLTSLSLAETMKPRVP